MHIHCRTCNQPIAVFLSEADFLNADGTLQAAVSQVIECPNCGEINARDFSREIELGETGKPFAAAPTARLGDGSAFEWWDFTPPLPADEGRSR